MKMMRCISAIFLGFVFSLGAIHAEEFTTLDGDHIKGATVKRVEPDGLVVAYSDGVIKLKFKNLPPEVGKKYGYDLQKAADFQSALQAQQVAAYQASVQRASTPTPTPRTYQTLKSQTAVIAQQASSSSASGDASTAENGSYYGEPNAYGVPKTVLVHNYYRKDGTYVRSHYRSKGR